jgi:hypothetical protein
LWSPLLGRVECGGSQLTFGPDTGRRPFKCVLCHNTFARSDTLKRHFEKCSIRNGNPTGIGHLSHPDARVVNAPAAAPSGSTANELWSWLGRVRFGEGMPHPHSLGPGREDGLQRGTTAAQALLPFSAAPHEGSQSFQRPLGLIHSRDRQALVRPFVLAETGVD